MLVTEEAGAAADDELLLGGGGGHGCLELYFACEVRVLYR